MEIISDWILIIIGVVMTVKAYSRIVNIPRNSVADFIILVEFIFCVLPILLNYLIGIPAFNTLYWYQSLIPGMQSKQIALIYDVYIGCSLILLYIYAAWHDKGSMTLQRVNTKPSNSPIYLISCIIAVLSPYLYIIITGNLSYFLSYNVSSNRGLDNSNFNTILSTLILVSFYFFCNLFFREKRRFVYWVILIIYSGLLAWIEGKRFIIALMLVVYLFYYTQQNLNKHQRRSLKVIIPILSVMLLMFSYFYLVVIRPLSDTGFSSVYEMLRVDFGRDPVIKFVINQEFFLHRPILDYRGESFLSTFLTFIPRSIWPNKPYPHYMYLTSRILNLPINNLPAGTTPSWFEMCLCNLGYLGYLVGTVTIPLFCWGADHLQKTSAKVVALILIIALLTQSLDAYVFFVLLFIIQYIYNKLSKAVRQLD